LPWLVPGGLRRIVVLGSHYGWISAQILPSPTLVFDTLGSLASSGELWMHVSASLSRIAVGFTGGVVLGVLLGACWDCRAQPSLTSFPASMPWCKCRCWLVAVPHDRGGDRRAIEVFADRTCRTGSRHVEHAAGFRRTPPAYLDVRACLRYSRRQTIFNVVLPFAVPVIGTGIRLAFTKAWLTLVVVELVASSEGLGLSDRVRTASYSSFDLVLASVLIVGAIGIVADRLLTVLEHKLSPSLLA